MHPYLIITHILLAFLVTTRTIAVIVRAILPVVDETYTIRNVWTWDTVFVDALWMTSLLVSDAFICYRTYIVWNRNIYTQIVPILILCGNIAVMVLRLRIEGNSELGSTNPVLYFIDLGNMTMIFAALTLALNLLNTGMIAYRIWTVRKSSQTSRTVKTDALTNMATLLVESAAIYTAVLVTDIIFLSLGNFLLLVFTDIQTPIIGIVFSNIIISVTQGSAFGASSTSGDNGTSGDRRLTWPKATGRVPFTPTEIAMQTMITTHTDPTVHDGRKMNKSYMDLDRAV